MALKSMTSRAAMMVGAGLLFAVSPAAIQHGPDGFTLAPSQAFAKDGGDDGGGDGGGDDNGGNSGSGGGGHSSDDRGGDDAAATTAAAARMGTAALVTAGRTTTGAEATAPTTAAPTTTAAVATVRTTAAPTITAAAGTGPTMSGSTTVTEPRVAATTTASRSCTPTGPRRRSTTAATSARTPRGRTVEERPATTRRHRPAVRAGRTPVRPGDRGRLRQQGRGRRRQPGGPLLLGLEGGASERPLRAEGPEQQHRGGAPGAAGRRRPAEADRQPLTARQRGPGHLRGLSLVGLRRPRRRGRSERLPRGCGPAASPGSWSCSASRSFPAGRAHPPPPCC